MKAEELRAALRAFMARSKLDGRKLTARPWSEKASLGQSFVGQFLRGDLKTITMDALDRLAAAAGVSIFEIIGEGPRAPSGMIAIAWLSLKREIDGRAEVGIDRSRRPLLMPRAWVEKYAFGEAGRIRMLELGETADAILRAGDIVAIDLTRNDPRGESGYYAIWAGNALAVRHVEPLLGDRLRMLAEGGFFEVDHGNVQIIGRAIWRAGDIQRALKMNLSEATSWTEEREMHAGPTVVQSRR